MSLIYCAATSKCLDHFGLSLLLQDELMEGTLTLVSDRNHFQSSLASLYQQEAG